MPPMPFVRRWLTSLCLLLSYNAASQPSGSFPFIHFGDGDGLQQAEIYGVAQDKDGYLLIGTNAGLIRFDGFTFRAVEPNGKNHAEMVIDRVFNWSNDSFLLVYSHPKGLGWYCNGEFSDFDIKESIPRGTNFNTTSEDGDFLFWGDAKAFFLNQKGIRPFDPVLEMNFEEFITLYSFNEDSFFVSTEKKSYLMGRDIRVIPGLEEVTSVLQLEDSLLLFSKGWMYGLVEGKISSKKALPGINGYVFHSLVDESGNVWYAGANSGLCVKQHSTGEVVNAAENLGIDDEQITHLFLDKSGNVWISTSSVGLLCVLKSAYTHYRRSDGLSSNSIRVIAESDDGVFVGTNNGLNLLSTESLVSKEGLQIRLQACEETKNAFQGYIHHILVHNDLLVVGTNLERRPAKYCDNPRVFSHPYGPSAVTGDTLVVGAWGRLLSFKLSDLPKQLSSINARAVPGFTKELFIHRLDNGALLIGTPQGLFKTYSGLKEVKRIDPGLGSDDIIFNDVATTSDGSFWFTTSAGLVKWDNKGEWSIVEPRTGVNIDYLRCIEVDAYDRIWLGSGKGIELYVDGVFTNYTTGSGLISNKVTTLHISKERNILWVGTDNGITKFRLDDVERTIERSMPLYITDVEVIGDTVFSKSDIPVLSPGQSSLRLHFASINYSNPTSVVYQYRLLPLTKDWIESTVNKAEFIALAPNAYKFEVRSKVSGGTWGEAASISLNIAPPYWKTIGFVLSVSVMVLVLVVVGFRWRIKVIRGKEHKKRLLLQKINYLEQQTMSLSMNPHFIFNSLNSIQHFFSGAGNLPAVENVSKFAKLIRLNMDATRKRTILLNDELTRLRLYLELEKQRFDKPLEYSIDVSPQLEQENPEIPNMVIQPLVENAIWHGILPSSKAGILSIEIADNNGLDIVIKDNGIGLTAAGLNARKGHKSLGLSLTRRRLSYLSSHNFLSLEEYFDADGNVEGTIGFLHIHRK